MIDPAGAGMTEPVLWGVVFVGNNLRILSALDQSHVLRMRNTERPTDKCERPIMRSIWTLKPHNPSCHLWREEEASNCGSEWFHFYQQQPPNSKAPSAKGCLKSKMMADWVLSMLGMPLPIYHRTNCLSTGGIELWRFRRKQRHDHCTAAIGFPFEHTQKMHNNQSVDKVQLDKVRVREGKVYTYFWEIHFQTPYFENSAFGVSEKAINVRP